MISILCSSSDCRQSDDFVVGIKGGVKPAAYGNMGVEI
jgi:hypothetical protein